MRLLILALLAPALAWAAPPKLPAPGAYECRIDKGYKFRDCAIKAADDGVAIEIPGGGMFGVSGHLFPTNEKRKIALVGSLNEEFPWGCFHCNAQCRADPSTCSCDELPAPTAKACKAQAVTATLTQKGKSWRGLLTFLHYGLRYTDGKVVGHQVEAMLMEFTIRPKR